MAYLTRTAPDNDDDDDDNIKILTGIVRYCRRLRESNTAATVRICTVHSMYSKAQNNPLWH